MFPSLSLSLHFSGPGVLAVSVCPYSLGGGGCWDRSVAWSFVMHLARSPSRFGDLPPTPTPPGSGFWETGVPGVAWTGGRLWCLAVWSPLLAPCTPARLLYWALFSVPRKVLTGPEINVHLQTCKLRGCASTHTLAEVEAGAPCVPRFRPGFSAAGPQSPDTGSSVRFVLLPPIQSKVCKVYKSRVCKCRVFLELHLSPHRGPRASLARGHAVLPWVG